MNEQPIKRGRGRPRGSRNKPKVQGTGDARASALGVQTPLASPPRTPIGSPAEPRVTPGAQAPAVGSVPACDATPAVDSTLDALVKQRDELQRRFDALGDLAMPRDIAALDGSIRQTTRLIAELRGETKLTPQKIVRSEAWQVLLARLGAALAPFPEAMAAVIKALEPEQ
jgi:hypothetical protein